MCVYLFQCVCVGLVNSIKFNSIMMARLFFFKRVHFYQCVLHTECILPTFSGLLLTFPTLCVSVDEICFAQIAQLERNLRYRFFLREFLLACMISLLAYFVQHFVFMFSIILFTIYYLFLRNQIELFFCFVFFIRLEDCCCLVFLFPPPSFQSE